MFFFFSIQSCRTLRIKSTRLRNRAEAALRGGADDGGHREALNAVIEESDGLIRVFNALLMIARAEAGYSSDYLVVYVADAVVSDIVEMYEPVAEEAGADSAGRDLVLARLVEILLIEALRAARSHEAPPGLLLGLADQRVADLTGAGARLPGQDRPLPDGRDAEWLR